MQLRNIGEYESAADALERFARENPADSSAPRALSDAIVLRIGLGEESKVDGDVDQYLRAYTRRTDDAANIALAVLLHASEKEDWSKVEREAARKMAIIERGPVSVAMAAHAVLGRAYAKHQGDARASREYARVRAMSERLGAPASDDHAEIHRFAKGLDALGEALVFAADEKRDMATWAPFPAYAGGDVDAWIASRVTSWIAARSAAIQAVSDEYKKVTNIQPVPPPRWVIDASARVAQMWTRASDEMSARLPARAPRSFKDKLDVASRPLRDARAKPAAIACVALSVKYEWTSDASQACGAWLERTYRREFPPLDELVIAPELRSSNVVPVGPARSD